MRVAFLSELDVRKMDARHWSLRHHFVFSVDEKMMRVPKGYTTDFASVPRLPLVYLATGDTVHKAAVIHDWLYEEQYHRPWADEVFLAAMKTEGVALWRRQLMYAAVRAFGGSRYGERAAQDDQFNP